MKKTLITLGVALMMAGTMTPLVQAANKEPGGFQGFLSGCCFGLRTGADYNDIGTGDRDFVSWFLVGFCLGPRTAMDYRDGKDFHWRDIGRVIPYVGIIFSVWDGIDIGSGKGRVDLQKAYGVSYY